MKPTYFTVGPSMLYPTVAAHIQNGLSQDIGSISHRGKAFEKLFQETTENLRALLNIPADRRLFFFSSATEIWERLIENCVDESIFHLVNGSFSGKFFEFSQTLGRKAVKHEVAPGNGFDLREIAVPGECEAIAAIVNETSSGVSMPLEDVSALALSHPEKLFFADVVTAVPAVSPDYSLIDCAYFSVQKGIGMPAGLGVAIVSERCIEKSKQRKADGKITGTYHSFSQLEKFAATQQTPATPNVLFIYLLGKVAGDMLTYGAEKMRNETRQKAEMLYRAMDQSALLSPFVVNPAHRSITTLVASVKTGSPAVIEALKKEGMIVSSGYGPFKEQHIRIANFPAHTLEATHTLAQRIAAL